MSTLETNKLRTLDGSVEIDLKDLLVIPRVVSIEALKGVSKSLIKNVEVLGYYKPGDGGGGTYRLSTTKSIALANDGSLILANDGGLWELIQTTAPTLKQFGAGFGGDDSTQIAKALSAHNVIIGGDGDYKVSKNIPLAGVLWCSGKGQTRFNVSGSGFDVFSATTDYASVVGGMTITSDSYRSSGITFNVVNNTRGNRFEDIRSQNQFLNYKISGQAVQTYLQRLEILDPAPTTGGGIFIDGGNDTFLDKVVMDSSGTQPAYGLRIQNSQAIWATDCDIIHMGTNLKIDPTTGDLITWLFFNHCAFDQASGTGVEITVQGTGSLRGVFFDACWSSTNNIGSTVTKATGAQLDTVQFNNCKMLYNKKQGALVNSGDNVSFSNGTYAGNSSTTSGAYAGIEFATGLSGFSAKNIRAGAVAGFTNTQKCGVLVGTNCDAYMITTCDLVGNVSAGLIDNSSTTATSRVEGLNMGTKVLA